MNYNLEFFFIQEKYIESALFGCVEWEDNKGKELEATER